MNSDLQNKMYHFEADPPKEVWSKIADALDADTEQTFPQRLYTYEEQPPAKIWNNIEASLEELEPAIRVVPITKFKKPLRYVAAAASIIGIVFLATTIANKNTGAGAVIGGTETSTVTASPVQSSVLPLNKPTLVDDSIANRQDAKQVADEPIAKNTQPKKLALTLIRPQGIFHSFSFSNRLIPEKANKEELFNYAELDSYMVYSDGDGNAMKLPKKLFSLVHCQDGDYSCKERIKKLQQKMASGATTTDFGGIIEILRQLQ